MRQKFTDSVATFVMLAMIPVLVIALATATLAARPTGATLTVVPNAAPAWGSATATGCGYGPAEVYLDIQKPEALAFMSAMPDAGGCVTFMFTTDGPGTYYLATRQKGNARHWRVMANYELPVT